MTDSLIATAAYGIESNAKFDSSPMEDSDFAGFLARVRFNRLSGLAVAAAQSSDLVVTDAQFDAIAALDLDVQRQVVGVEYALLGLSAALERQGIETRVLKGPAFAHRFWARPELRPFVDLDLLVRGQDMDRTVALCHELGATRPLPELRGGFDGRFGKGVTLIGPGGYEWDLHRTLMLGPFSFLVEVEDLWAGDETFALAGRQLSMPTPEACFVHACLHATATGTQRLVSIRDLVQLATGSDLAEVALLARRWSASAAVVSAVDAATDRLRLEATELATWAAELPVSTREEKTFQTYLSGGLDPSRLALRAWPYVPGLRDKAAYAWALVMPDRTNRRARGRTAFTQLRDLVRGIG